MFGEKTLNADLNPIGSPTTDTGSKSGTAITEIPSSYERINTQTSKALAKSRSLAKPEPLCNIIHELRPPHRGDTQGQQAFRAKNSSEEEDNGQANCNSLFWRPKG